MHSGPEALNGKRYLLAEKQSYITSRFHLDTPEYRSRESKEKSPFKGTKYQGKVFKILAWDFSD
jgi:hypothetical protein